MRNATEAERSGQPARVRGPRRRLDFRPAHRPARALRGSAPPADVRSRPSPDGTCSQVTGSRSSAPICAWPAYRRRRAHRPREPLHRDVRVPPSPSVIRPRPSREIGSVTADWRRRDRHQADGPAGLQKRSPPIERPDRHRVAVRHGGRRPRAPSPARRRTSSPALPAAIAALGRRVVLRPRPAPSENRTMRRRRRCCRMVTTSSHRCAAAPR